MTNKYTPTTEEIHNGKRTNAQIREDTKKELDEKGISPFIQEAMIRAIQRLAENND